MNKSTVLHVLPNAMPPKAFLEELLTKYPTVFGFAARHGGELICESHLKGWSVDDTTELLETTKLDHRVLFLGNWPNSPVEGDVPPYVMLDSDNNNFLAIFPEGDFAGFTGLDGEHADEYCMASEFLFPKLEKMIKDAVGDTEKFFGSLRADGMKKFLANAYKHRGYFLFLPKEGDPIIFGENNSIGQAYSFGTLSNAEGLNFKETKEPKKEAEPLSFLDRVRGKKTSSDAGKTVTPPSIPEVPKDVQPSVKPAGTETVIPLVEMSPPKSLQDGGVRNHWLRLFNAKKPGHLPDNHTMKNITVWVHPSLVPFAKREIKGAGDMKKLAGEVKTFHANGGQAKDFKTEAPKSVEKSASTVREPYVPKSEGSTLQFLSDKEKMLGVEVVSKYLDVKSNQRLSPLEMQKLESNWGQYSDEIGSDFTDLLFVPPVGLLELFGNNKPAVSAFIQMRRRWIQDTGFKMEDLINSKGEKPKVADASPKGEEKIAQPAQASGGFSFLRKSAA